MEHIALDLTPSGSGLLSRCHASQYDIGRQVCFDLYNVGAVFTLAGTETIKLKIRRPDGVAVEDNITNTSSTYVVWTSASGDCDAEGNAECELIVTDNGTRIGSANFIMEVEPDPYNGNVNIKSASGAVASFSTDIEDNLVECKATITPYQGAGVDKITIINSKTAPVKSTTPYLIKETPSGNGELDKLIGGTVAFNQLIDIPSSDKSKTSNNVTITDNRDGSYTISTTAEGATAQVFINPVFVASGVQKDHKYYFYGFGANQSNQTYRLADAQDGVLNFNLQNSGVISATNNGYLDIHIVVASGAIITTSVTVKPMITDLTAMFGSTIADYVYTLESGTSGSGVSWLKSHGFFTKPYYPYDTGSLLSVKASKHITVGFNQWDEEWELGSYSWGTGEPFADNTRIRNKNFIPVLPNVNYFNSNSGYAIDYYFFDADKNFISPIYKAPGNQTITTPANCYYMNFCVYASYGTTYNHDICVNISDNARNGTYEPYVSHEYTLDDIELRGILKLDGNNNLYYDGDTYSSSGEVVRKYGIVDLGTLNWKKDTSGDNWAFYLDNGVISNAYVVTSPNEKAHFMAKYETVIASGNTSYPNNYVIFQKANGQVFVVDRTYSDKDAFKTAMDGIYLVYEKATPTTETADTFTNPQVCEEGGTEEYIDGRTVEMPVGHDTIYGTDIEAVTVEFGTTVTSGVIDVTNGILTPTGDDPISVTPAYIPTFNGNNNVMSDMDGGTVEVKYYENGGA